MNNIHDPYLRRSALASLRKSGNDQQNLYDLSYSAYNQQMRGPHENDLGILILLDEEIRQGIIDSECVQKWLNQFSEAKATVDVILVASPDIPNENQILSKFADAYPNACILKLPIKAELDPLALRQHIALKMLLNAHSTAVMAKLGRVVGNTMVNVNPGNLKLYGRATFMIQSHVNDHLPKSAALTYAEANAVLFNAIDYIKNSAKSGQQTSEVSLSIIRILEAVKRGTNISWEQAEEIGSTQGLEAFLQNYSH